MRLPCGNMKAKAPKKKVNNSANEGSENMNGMENGYE